MKIRFAPGTGYGYSNVGYGAAALAIERAAGRPFPAVLRERLLDPLGLQATGFYADPRWSRVNVASGHDDGKVLDSPATWAPPQWGLLGDGGVVATAGDLCRFWRAVIGGTYLDEAHKRSFLDEGIPAPGRSVAWRGFGERRSGPGAYRLTDPRGRRLHYKRGSNDFGFVPFVLWREDDDRTVIGLFSGGVRTGFAEKDAVAADHVEHSTLYRRLAAILDEL